MKHFVIILALICMARNCFSDEAYVRHIRSNGEEELDVSTLPKEARDKIAWLRPGLMRSEIEDHFEMDGGICSCFEQVYLLKTPVVAGKHIKLELAFQPAGMPDDVYADRTRAIKWTRDHQMDFLPTDVLRNTSKPYLGLPIGD